jgi:hypothetical protein
MIFVDVMKQLGNAHEANKKEVENFSWETL